MTTRLKVEQVAETDDTLCRFAGAALHRMMYDVRLRRDTLNGKRGRRQDLSDQSKVSMKKELEILDKLIMIDKSGISVGLKNLDEGRLTFPRKELLPFLKSVDSEVCDFANDTNLKKYPSKFLKMCQDCVVYNECLETDSSY